jgi:phosphatidylinositol alpha-mannosyltransferase
VHVDPRPAARTTPGRDAGRLRIVFVGQPVPRKGLPVLLSAFDALRRQIPAELVLVGPSPDELERMTPSARDVRALGKLDDRAKRRELERADVLCAPALGGESFGMVLTEAFAAATPVVASDIAGYRDVVRDGIDGVLVSPGDARALTGALHALWAQPERRAQMSHAAAAGVERFAWPRVTAQILDAYQSAMTIWSASRRARPRWSGRPGAAQIKPAATAAGRSTQGQALLPGRAA